MEGGAYRLVKGRHFEITVEGMRGNVLGKAKDEGIAVRAFRGTMVQGEAAPRRTLYIEFFPGRTYLEGPPEGK